MIAGSSQNLPTPAAVSMTARVAGSNETALTTTGTSASVKVTALNYFGETAASSITTVTTASGQVLDVTITPVPGAQQYNIYFGANSTSNLYLQAGTSVQSGVTYTGAQTANAVGGVKFTIQGAPSVAANHAPPSSDTGTGGSNRMEGLIPTLSGLSDTGSGPYANVGFESSGAWQGGYINQSVSTHLQHQRDLHGARRAVGEQRAEQRHPGRVQGGPV